MGLGLGMGIKMGNDGRFYASMGGVTMPGGSEQINYEPSSTLNSTEAVRQNNKDLTFSNSIAQV